MEKQVINELLDKRDLLIKGKKNSKKVDEIQVNIADAIRKNFDKYEVDFILETWTRFGASPSLIHDDNGLFAISDGGFQPVVTGKQKIHGAITVFVNRKQWKNSIRKALKQYISA